jgi:hypothetical protein
VLLAAAAAAMAVAGCGAESKSSQPTGQPTVSLWVSSTVPEYRQVNAGAKLALSDHGGRSGAFRVNYAARSLDPAQPRATQDALEAARMTLQDTQSSAMLTFADDDASRAAITLLNEAGIGTVSLGDARLKTAACSPRSDFYPNGRATAIVVAPGLSTGPAAFRSRFEDVYGFAPTPSAYRAYEGADAILKSLAARGVATDDTPARLDRDALAAELVRSHGECG